MQAFTARFTMSMQLYHPRNKTAHRALQRLFLRLCPLNRPLYQTHTSGYNTACTTLERITAPQHLQHIPDTRCYAGRCAAQHRPPIIIRYIRGQQIADYASPAAVSIPPTPGGLQSGTGQQSGRTVCLAPSTRRGSPATRARRAARNHWRLPPYLFSGFRPIANRGQQ